MRLTALAVGVVLATAAVGAQTPSAHAQENQNQQAKQVNVTVSPGDTLSGIASAHQTTYVRLFDANTNIADPDLIYPGDKVRIPDADEQLPDRPLPANVVATEAPETAPAVTPAPAVNPPAPRPAVAAPRKMSYTLAPVAATGSVWDRLAACESGGNWSINTGNGFYGGLQFTASTWLANGGGAYAPTANLASRDQQIAIASKVQAARGWSPWPACSARLGL